mmetsp:Transcript_139972/g.390209  ORF Transcript_139972/g.390209 Transcript_139972/m.390209 type:complete len:341 (-) Transcript_139972:169-1191(-)
MVPPPTDGLPEDFFECGICKDLLLDPVTLSCCGKSFCQDCLRQCLRAAAKTGVARCPAGCGQIVPFRLPAPSQLLQRCLEALEPEALARRREAAAELEAEEAEAEPGEAEAGGAEVGAGDPPVAAAADGLPGGFQVWEEVAASRDLTVGDRIVAVWGTPGVVLGPAERTPDRIEVIFDERTDFARSSLNVRPFELERQLPAHFGVRIAQPVVATKDLFCGPTLLARLGSRGVVRCRHSEERATVQFDQRADGSELPVNVHFSEVTPQRTLLGGYRVGQRVAASQDLFSGNTLMVHSGTLGSVCCEYSDARLTVKFDSRADGSSCGVNLTLAELRPLTPER